MPTLVSWGFSGTPASKLGQAGAHYAETFVDGGGPEERARHADEALHALQEPINLAVMLTAFRSPVGFGQDILDQLAQGNVDIALGKAAVFAPMMIPTIPAMLDMGRSLVVERPRRVVRSLLRRPIYHATIAATDVVAAPGGATPTPTSRARAAAGAARAQVGRATGLVYSLLRHPKETVGHAIPRRWGAPWRSSRAGFSMSPMLMP